MDWNWNFGFINYGPRWRVHRRAFHQHFRFQATDAFQQVQELEARKFVDRLLRSPDQFRRHIDL